MKQFLSFLLCCTLTLSSPVLAAENSEADLSVSAPSVLLMEASTGTVVYEKNAHEIRHPASITKIMTLILIFDAIERGQISLTDTVTVSEYAASMGGSQVFLEPGTTIIPFSAETKQGREEIWELIDSLVLPQDE